MWDFWFVDWILLFGVVVGLFIVDGDLVWYWWNFEDFVDLSGDFCVGSYVGVGRGKKCVVGVDLCCLFVWC